MEFNLNSILNTLNLISILDFKCLLLTAYDGSNRKGQCNLNIHSAVPYALSRLHDTLMGREVFSYMLSAGNKTCDVSVFIYLFILTQEKAERTNVYLDMISLEVVYKNNNHPRISVSPSLFGRGLLSSSVIAAVICLVLAFFSLFFFLSFFLSFLLSFFPWWRIVPQTSDFTADLRN